MERPILSRRALLGILLAGVACRPTTPATQAVAPTPAAPAAAVPQVAVSQVAAIRPPATPPESVFGQTFSRLSEPGGYFASENVVSNETSYLHVLDAFRRVGVQGGAYIGVGPDQNFSYIAAIRPKVAFMFDIRRD